MKKYLRLLSYDNACKVIDFINKNDENDYANIVPGGVSIQVMERNWTKVEAFIKSLDVRYEIGDMHPHTVHQQIVEMHKRVGIID